MHQQCVPDSLQQASYIHRTPQKASYAQQKPHQTTYITQISILPQQSNYTIHIAQEITNRSTQTADFSEAKGSTDSDDNDDQLSWQAVRGRGKKKQAPEPQKCQQRKRISRMKQPPTSANDH
jgi:hypothetical protein